MEPPDTISLLSTKFDGGYVHNGLLKAAVRVFDVEWEVLRESAEIHPH